ncbi:MAG: thiamine-phosphate kinase [bacterium]|nr:thiamine-phosphate kinase [bacterium]
MKLRQLGEFGLIQRIEREARRIQGAGVALGIGDDAALLRAKTGEDVAVTSDAFVEGVHFRFDHESPRTAGRRALAATLSDLAAMGARPLGFTLSLSVAPSRDADVVLAVVKGGLDVAAEYACPLVGGNVTASKGFELHATALGAVTRGRALQRAGGRPGDRLFLSGPLGQSALERARGRVRHVPEPRIALGRALAWTGRVSACIDISDGVLADLAHLCRASDVGARLRVSALPRPPGFEAACQRVKRDPEDLLLSGGEDYELLFSVRGSAPIDLPPELRSRTSLSPVGVLARGGLELVGGQGWEADGGPETGGWRHF